MRAITFLALSLPTHTPALLRYDGDVCYGNYGASMVCASFPSDVQFFRAQFPVSQKVGTLGSGGQLVSGTTAKVVKCDGTLALIGEVGELLVQGPQVAVGYYRNDEACVTSIPLVMHNAETRHSTKQTFVDGYRTRVM